MVEHRSGIRTLNEAVDRCGKVELPVLDDGVLRIRLEVLHRLEVQRRPIHRNGNLSLSFHLSWSGLRRPLERHDQPEFMQSLQQVGDLVPTPRPPNRQLLAQRRQKRINLRRPALFRNQQLLQVRVNQILRDQRAIRRNWKIVPKVPRINHSKG